LAASGVFKIADFGLAKYVDDFSNQLLRSIVGSPLYMAPQILLRKPYTTKCDIWSLGIIFYEMVFNDAPWKGRDERDLIKNIHTLPIEFKKNGISLSAKGEEFLKKTLIIEETERATWDKIFELFELPIETKFSSNKSSGKKIFS
jgi:calcium-dependent protein kinase